MEHTIQEQVNKMALKFNMNALTNEILINLQTELNQAFRYWKNEAKSKFGQNTFGDGSSPEVSSYLRREGNIIIGYLQANTSALANSYGTGSLMLDNNPGLAAYKRSNLWNPARKGKEIVGRPKGDYVSLFGNKRSSTGSAEGVNLEGKRVYIRKKSTESDYYILPSPPSYALQLAEEWLYKTYLPRAYKEAIKSINFGKFLIES